MEHKTPILLCLSIFLLHHLLLPISHAQLFSILDGLKNSTEIYIINVERHERHELLNDKDLESWHASFLPNSTLDSGAPRLIYSYRHVINGFAAHLTLDELETVKSKPGFLHARRDRLYHLTTTYTPRYLGLTTINGWGSTMMGEGIIIGVIDTGIKPNHPSFDDSAMPPPPPKSKWKGGCSFKGFHCNNKIIGAKAFKSGSNPSPLDTEGHGTHVAGTIAGSFVKDANVLGMAKGTASGMAPMAHLAIYKVCFPNLGCPGSDTLKAIDQAIKDGVDIISMSISGSPKSTFYEDDISVGSLAAMQHGIVAVAAAGNDGPEEGTLAHCAPWVLVVGASTTDRRIVSIVKLGNGKTFHGESAYQPKTWDSKTLLPIAYPGENRDDDTMCCVPKTLANLNLKGKIVICKSAIVDDVVKGGGAYKVGAEGMLLLNIPTQGYTTFSKAHLLPTSNVNYTAALQIIDYYFQTKPKAMASISFAGTEFGSKPSPAVVYFSSRGPSIMNGGIIKPDVLAPGVNILAAYHEDVGPNPNPLATHTFNFESGTSMATPHVAGIVALIREKHRGWTPSEIISAIVTTANDSPGQAIIDDAHNEAAGIYTTGGGQVNPIKAMDPGLVFGLTFDDYVGYLCGLGYSKSEIFRTVAAQKDCRLVKSLNAMELNYPSIAVNLTRTTTRQKVSRVAKNVGDASEEYKAKITEPAGVKINLSTYTLKFTRVDQVESYEISFEMSGSYPSQGSDMIRRGKIVWDSGKHAVTTPIAIRFV